MLIRAIRYVVHRLILACLGLIAFNTFVQPALGLQNPVTTQVTHILKSFDALIKALGDPPDDGSR